MSKSILIFLLVVLVNNANSQTPGQNKSILLSAVIQNNPAKITINWQALSGSTSIKIYRKTKTSSMWGDPLANDLPGTTVSWTDNNVEAGVGYEYRVISLSTNYAFGYIFAGIDLPEIFSRGKVLLVYDSVSTDGLEFEINRWINDVVGDGYEVIKIAVDQNDKVSKVKEKIVNAYNNDPQEVKTVFLFGRVPVPYSGVIAPDGHVPDHQGAWPADGYYAELNGTWSDVLANNTGASSTRNQNKPGDGKFDQHTFPSDLELQIGRVDMHNLPSFSSSEKDLLKKYLNKNHAFRNKLFTAIDRALIDDEFSGYPEGFSASGWRSFSSLCGQNKTQAGDYLTTLKENNYLWSYGCGAGNFKNCSGVIGSPDFVKDSLKGIFTMLFGSYFGDWDSPDDNLMRSSLASGSTLANCWSGRPYWHFHHMALGENIGYSALVSMNNSGIYDFNNNQRGIHMALLGDPTLRAHMIAPVQNLIVAKNGNIAQLSWTEPADTILGYNIYRKNDTINIFEKINDKLITSPFYTDSCVIYPGIYTYMVRTVKLEKTNSGSYFNMSTGKTTDLINSNYIPVTADFTYNAEGYKVVFNNFSKNASNYIWDFGDGNTSTDKEPLHEYAHKGTYKIELTSSSGCGTDTVSRHVVILTGGLNDSFKQYAVFPNPANEKIHVFCKSENTSIFYKICDLHGNISKTGIIGLKNMIDISDLKPGLYYLSLNKDENPGMKFIKL
jgi:hypothetical protein